MIKPALALLPFALTLSCLACSRDTSSAIFPSADLRPPGLLEAGPTDSRTLVLRFDEPISQVEGSFVVEPAAELEAKVEASDLLVTFSPKQRAGADYALAGEVDDQRGNRTRFLVRFAGWNDRAPELRLSELQTGKNSSKTKPHRDYVELQARADGNIGGEELFWASSTKSYSYKFPSAEVKKDEYIVLHLAPEGIPDEKDETGSDLAASGGVDSSATGRDFWRSGSPLPDSSGVVGISIRPGAQPGDGLFYAPDSKSGDLPEDELSTALKLLVDAGVWPAAKEKAAWEDAFRWKSSSSRPICRSSGEAGKARGPSAWFVAASGAQSPGAANPSGDEGSTKAKSATPHAKKQSKKTTKQPSSKVGLD